MQVYTPAFLKDRRATYITMVPPPLIMSHMITL